MSAVAFHPCYDHEGDGYNTFRGAATHWARIHDAAVYEIPAAKMVGTVPKAAKASEIHARARAVHAIIEKLESPITDIAFFCHGWRSGFQLLYDIATIRDFVRFVAPKADQNIRIWLYCCACVADLKDGKWKPSKTGTGNGSAADEMRDEFCRCGVTGVVVDAHATAGHATGNPYVKRCTGPTVGDGGYWIVDPFNVDKTLWNRWKAAIEHTDLEFTCTKIDAEKIHAGLGAIGMTGH